MFTADLESNQLVEMGEALRVSFPLHSATGTADTATVWMNLDPGGEVPEHRDSAEELLLVVEGEVEATIGDETARMRELELALVPSMAPHALRNVGERRARILGYFASSTVVSTFAEPFGPDGMQVFVTGAPGFLAAPLEKEAITLTP